jgi:SAM-dependent MidA family methyltransferase
MPVVHRLIGEATRLVSPDEMGTVYKVLAITQRKDEKPLFVPVAFEEQK